MVENIADLSLVPVRSQKHPLSLLLPIPLQIHPHLPPLNPPTLILGGRERGREGERESGKGRGGEGVREGWGGKWGREVRSRGKRAREWGERDVRTDSEESMAVSSIKSTSLLLLTMSEIMWYSAHTHTDHVILWTHPHWPCDTLDTPTLTMSASIHTH